jgi:hypothetical protein
MLRLLLNDYKWKLQSYAGLLLALATVVCQRASEIDFATTRTSHSASNAFAKSLIHSVAVTVAFTGNFQSSFQAFWPYFGLSWAKTVILFSVT